MSEQLEDYTVNLFGYRMFCSCHRWRKTFGAASVHKHGSWAKPSSLCSVSYLCFSIVRLLELGWVLEYPQVSSSETDSKHKCELIWSYIWGKILHIVKLTVYIVAINNKLKHYKSWRTRTCDTVSWPPRGS